MSKNVVLAMVLSFGILIGWEFFVMRPQRQGLPPPPKPGLSAPTEIKSAHGSVSAPAGTPAAPVRMEKLVEYEIGRHRVVLNSFGGSVQQWWLREHEKGDAWIPLLPAADGGDSFGTFPDVPFSAQRRGEKTLVLTGRRADGLRVEKVLEIDPDGHLHKLTVTATNESGAPLEARYDLAWGPGLQAGDADAKEGLKSQRAIAFEPPRLLKIKSGDHTGPAAWWAVDARYFLAAFFNDSGQNVLISVNKNNDNVVAKKSSSVALAAGQSAAETVRFYLGPKGYAQLSALGQGLERSVDFGFFGEVGKVVLRVLYFFHKLTGNYGWAIVLLTMLIQIVTVPLTIKSFKHSVRMKAIQPQMKKLQDLYKSDPKRLNAEMLNLYQKHGLKFMGMEGCFPVLVQLPVFWALYTTLRNAYELRGAPWLGWVTDLSVHDPYYVLPVLMGGGMFLQQKVTMAAMDPAQARMMLMMPVIFTFFFLKLPSGLVLYWFTNSVLSLIVQAVLIKRNEAHSKVNV